MAIKFGDILQNQNSAYPIVDGSNNDLKGVLFSAGLPGATSFPNKRALGTILVDTSNLKLYLYIGADLANSTWGNANSWSEFAQGNGESIQTSAIPVAIGAGNSFGKYENGSTINVGSEGWSALQIILDALTSYQAPTGAFDGTEGLVPYDTTDQTTSHTVSFEVTNNNQQVVSGTNFAISAIRLYRRLGTNTYVQIASATSGTNTFTTGTLNDLNTQGPATAETFTFADSFTVASGSADFNYKVEIDPLDGSGAAASTITIIGTDAQNASGYINCLGYSAPTILSDDIARQNTSSHFVGNAETDLVREKGNIASKLTFKIQCNSSSVPITSFSVKRSINGAAAVTIKTVTTTISGTSSTYQFFDSVAIGANNVTGLNTDVAGYTDVDSAYPTDDTDADTVLYTVVCTDAEQTTTLTLDEEINFEFPGIIGYGTTDPSAFTTANNGTMAVLLGNIRDNSGLRAQYEILSSADTQTGVDADFGVVNLSTNSNQYVYIGYPAVLDALDTVLDPGGTPTLGAFGTNPKSTTVTYETHYGISGTYEFYGSNSFGAFSGNYTIN